MIDRIAPTRRPAGAAIGYQRWRSLLFTHWTVPVETLRPLVPASLELDLHDGLAYVGVVPFVMRDVRPWWSPAFMAFNFLETNVRTYVYQDDRPGVYFFSLDAASWLAVRVARSVWGLPYYYADMHSTTDGDVVHYRTTRRNSGAAHDVRYRRGEQLAASTPGTLEFFLLERYLLFVERAGRLQVGQVHHDPYPVERAELLDVHDGLLAAAGLTCGETPPTTVHYSTGVDVEIFKLRDVT